MEGNNIQCSVAVWLGSSVSPQRSMASLRSGCTAPTWNLTSACTPPGTGRRLRHQSCVLKPLLGSRTQITTSTCYNSCQSSMALVISHVIHHTLPLCWPRCRSGQGAAAHTDMKPALNSGCGIQTSSDWLAPMGSEVVAGSCSGSLWHS